MACIRMVLVRIDVLDNMVVIFALIIRILIVVIVMTIGTIMV